MKNSGKTWQLAIGCDPGCSCYKGYQWGNWGNSNGVAKWKISVSLKFLPNKLFLKISNGWSNSFEYDTA